MDTELEPKIHAYITYRLKESIDGARYAEQSDLVGWDTVSAHQVSDYQKNFMGKEGYMTFMWEFGHPEQTLYYWNTDMGWKPMAKNWLNHVVPKELRMKVLCGAL